MNLIIDATGMLCPMPVIKLQNQIKRMEKNQRVEIICTDPGVKHDIPTWCRLQKHSVIEMIEKDEKIIFLVQKN